MPDFKNTVGGKSLKERLPLSILVVLSVMLKRNPLT